MHIVSRNMLALPVERLIGNTHNNHSHTSSAHTHHHNSHRPPMTMSPDSSASDSSSESPHCHSSHSHSSVSSYSKLQMIMTNNNNNNNVSSSTSPDKNTTTSISNGNSSHNLISSTTPGTGSGTEQEVEQGRYIGDAESHSSQFHLQQQAKVNCCNINNNNNNNNNSNSNNKNNHTSSNNNSNSTAKEGNVNKETSSGEMGKEIEEMRKVVLKLEAGSEDERCLHCTEEEESVFKGEYKQQEQEDNSDNCEDNRRRTGTSVAVPAPSHVRVHVPNPMHNHHYSHSQSQSQQSYSHSHNYHQQREMFDGGQKMIRIIDDGSSTGANNSCRRRSSSSSNHEDDHQHNGGDGQSHSLLLGHHHNGSDSSDEKGGPPSRPPSSASTSSSCFNSIITRPQHHSHHQYNNSLKFSIEDILRPDFGKVALQQQNDVVVGNNVNSNGSENLYNQNQSSNNDQDKNRSKVRCESGSVKSYNSSSTVPESSNRDRPSRPSSVKNHSEDSNSSCTSLLSRSTEVVDETKVNPKVPQGPLLWPAWVYCTRYSDRPSSGPRSRRIRKREGDSVNGDALPEEKRPRTAFTSEQLARLKQEFEENRYLTEKRRQDLARDLKLHENQIKIWFQNKRAKLKKSTGQRGGLALQLMAQGLYNHSTVPIDEDEDLLLPP